MEHNSDFSHDLVVGKLGERVVDKMYEGDRVEVKSEQDQWKNTGNVFVEFWCRGGVSGIAKTKSKWWITNFYYKGEFQFNIAIQTDKLRKMVMEEGKYITVRGGDSNTSKGFLVPIEDLIK